MAWTSLPSKHLEQMATQWVRKTSSDELSRAIVAGHVHRPEEVKILLRNDDVIHRVIQSKNQEALEIVLRMGADVESRSSYDFTPLFSAVELNNVSAVRSLIAHGAKLDTVVVHTKYTMRYMNNITALSLAVHRGYVEIAELLLEAGSRSGDNIPTMQCSLLFHQMLLGIRYSHFSVPMNFRLLFLLAEYGAERGEYLEQAISPVLQRQPPSDLRLLPTLCSFLAIGCSITKEHQENHEMLEHLERKLVTPNIAYVAALFHESGYIFKHLSKIESSHQALNLDGIKTMRTLQSTPLSLQRLAANVLRTGLRPNAIAGVKRLPLHSNLRSFITLSLSTDNIQQFAENLMQEKT